MGVGKRFATLLLSAAMALALLALAACSGGAQDKMATAGNGSFTLDGGSVEVQDDQLRVSLDANPTTGYTWMMRIDGNSLELAGEDFQSGQSADESKTVVGSGGVQQFTFRGMDPGSATVTFDYERPWEEAEPARTVVLQVTVGADGVIADTMAELTVAETSEGEDGSSDAAEASGESA